MVITHERSRPAAEAVRADRVASAGPKPTDLALLPGPRSEAILLRMKHARAGHESRPALREMTPCSREGSRTVEIGNHPARRAIYRA